MKEEKRNFNKVIKVRKKRALKVKRGLNNHAYGNSFALLRKQGKVATSLR